jgi:P-type Ca2+ transporter type 2C
MQNLVHLPHASPYSTLLKALKVDLQLGITEVEFNRRLRLAGKNSIQSFRQRSAWKVLVDQFLSLIVALLAVAAAIAFFTGDVIEGVAILVALLLNAGVGFATEWQADRALQVLGQQAKMTARVRRDKQERLVDAEELVPGDLVILNAGDKVPADGRVVETFQQILFLPENLLNRGKFVRRWGKARYLTA